MRPSRRIAAKVVGRNTLAREPVIIDGPQLVTPDSTIRPTSNGHTRVEAIDRLDPFGAP
jgi:hypothetical protein